MAVFGLGLAAAFAGDAESLIGEWEITELVVGGKKVEEKEIKGMKFVFDKEKLTIVPPAADGGIVDKRTFSYKVDSKAKPATVMLTALDGEHKGTVSPGIFEIEKGTMKWCQSDEPKAKEPPKTFESPEKSAIYLFTFKKGK
jgi:uncharacterized protein (TIGR03067 family)